MYAHKVIKFNYTTYDMRRDQDVLNPGTSHCNIMTLARRGAGNEASESDEHPFLYARVLGIFHVNVVYNGPGMIDYNPQRFDFLWVRWYDLEELAVTGKGTKPKGSPFHLDRLAFPSLNAEGAIGFLDPANVLRSCHIIPAFSKGKRYLDGQGLSKHARDSGDWKNYYVSRYD